MTHYTAHFFSAAPQYATHDFEAKSPEKALAIAYKFWRRHHHTLDFESVHASRPIDRIEISGPKEPGQAAVVWQSDEMLMRIAAANLLGALKHVLDVLASVKPADP